MSAESFELPERKATTSSSEDVSYPRLSEATERGLGREEGLEVERLLEGDPDGESDDDDDKAALLHQSMDILGGDDVRTPMGTVEAMIARTVPSTDDPTLPTLTLRVLILGSAFCILGASASQVFYFKSNAPQFSSYFVLLATYPLGHALARWLPKSRLLGWELNPGPFGIKEHILIGVLSSSGASAAYGSDILAILDLYYKQPLGMIPSLILLLTTQCIGFGLAGMLQTLLVNTPSMFWPETLVTVQLFTTLHPSSSSSTQSKALTNSRLKLFITLTSIVYIYQFLPALLFPTLTSVAVLCLASGSDKGWWIRALGSGYRGLGIGTLSFDWSSIGSQGPLYTPWWALGNFFGGLVGMIWVVMPIILVTNFWDARAFPIPVSAGLFNSTFRKFDVTAILKPDLSLDEEAWATAKPMLLTPYFALSYMLSFASLTSVLVHVWIWHRDEIKQALSKRAIQDDIHNTLMRAYKSVPSSWYIALLAVNFMAAVILVETTPLQTPIWALVLAIGIATLFLVPVGIITAVSNTTIGLNVLTEFIAGILMPGKPIANVMFKCYGYMAMSQALALTGDLKLGWYTSIPPRHMFACQIIGTVLGAISNYFTLVSVLSTKHQYLDGSVPDPTQQWTGRAPNIFFSASILYGAVAPGRFFVGKYAWLYLGFVLGAVVPVACWFAHRRWPHAKFNKVVFPIICHGATTVPQYPTNIILSSIAVATASNEWIAKRYPKQHGRYVYVVSSALDAATSLNAMTVYLICGVLTSWPGPDWWGNSMVDSEHCLDGS